MNQVANMFIQSNKRMDEIMGGAFLLEQVSAAQREFEGQIKLINAVVSAFGIMSKNKRAMAGLEKMNILDSRTAISLISSDPNSETVKCEETGSLILKETCLDCSGSNHDDCEGCETGRETREALLPS